MRVRFERAMNDDELLKFCAANELLRIERDSNGELIVMSPNHSEGSSLEAEVLADLAIWTRSDGRGKFFGSNAGFTLPDGSMRAPDASWISLKRWNALTGEQRRSFAPICPEFVIEIRSKSDRLQTLRAKMEMWIANGAELAWLIGDSRQSKLGAGQRAGARLRAGDGQPVAVTCYALPRMRSLLARTSATKLRTTGPSLRGSQVIESPTCAVSGSTSAKTTPGVRR